MKITQKTSMTERKEKEERTGHTFNVNFSTIKQCLREKQTTEHDDTELEVE